MAKKDRRSIGTTQSSTNSDNAWWRSDDHDAHKFLRPRKDKQAVSGYRTMGDLVAKTADRIFSPPERLSVSESAAQYRYINNRGQYVGPWQNEETPYMVQPMDTLNSKEFDSVVFVGPAQCGKTDGLIINWILFSTVVDPLDLILYNPSGAAAKDFSVRRVDRLIRDSKAVGEALLKERDTDNKFSKQFKNGMLLTLSWPTVNELSGKPVGRVAITDYDRIEDDIGGEGSAYDLGKKRTTTFGSFAMTLAESSPSREVEDPKKILSSIHEAPPCKGILSLYNRGDRRLWFWPCPDCGNYFSPRFEMLVWDDSIENPAQAAKTAKMQCPHCDSKIAPDQRRDMQQWGLWLGEGQAVDGDAVRGRRRESNIASFWLEGTAATFTTWPKLVKGYIDAMRELDDTGSEEALKKFYNTDLGRPYVPKGMETERKPEEVMSRAEKIGKDENGEVVVPEDTRCLVACIDVQQNSFVVQVHGILPGRPHDIIVVDRFDIRKSIRLDDDGDKWTVRPGTYLEDWDLLIDQVINKTYPLSDGSGRRMAIKLTLCDSGGEAKAKGAKGGTTGSGGVTSNAYAFWRSLRDNNLHRRFHLIKGTGSPSAPRADITYPDSRNRKNKAMAQGDVPVLMLQSNTVKDTLNNLLDVIEPAKGLIRFPDWLPDWFYSELCAEIRTDKGWVNPRKRNESWDLLYYLIGAGFSSLLPLHKVDWQNPPLWLAPWDSNNLVVPADQKGETPFSEERSGKSFAELGKKLA